jgi:DNA mismatch repair protein MutS2
MKSAKEVKEAVYFIKQDISDKLHSPLELSRKPFHAGDLVRIKSLKREGKIRTAPERGKLEIEVGKLMFRADPEDVEFVRKGVTEKNTSKKSIIGVDMQVATPKWEVNVIGLRAEEALPIIEKAIDNAMLSGLTSLRIIHGKGTGRLKKAIAEYLSKQSYVKAFHQGASQEGGAGVTIVDLIPE